MTRLIDADALLKQCEEMDKIAEGISQVQLSGMAHIEQLIIEAPTIDAVPVVRCKDCRWWEDMYGNGVKGYCHACKHGYYSPTWEISIQRTTDPDFYCGDGERREP